MQQLQKAIADDVAPDTEASEVERCARELLDSVPPVIWSMRRAMRSHRKGLSMPQFRALVQVHQTSRVCLSDIAANMGASLPTTSRLISGLVDHGFIDRVGCTEDRRQIILRITPRGEEILKSAWDSGIQAMAKTLANLTATERRDMLAGLAVVKKKFGAIGVNMFAPRGEPAPTTVIDSCDEKPLRDEKRILLEAPPENIPGGE
jgi:DNA-binding MarR family transcriptional regulator